MSKKPPFPALPGATLSIQPWPKAGRAQTRKPEPATDQPGDHAFLLRVRGNEASQVLEAVVPVLGQILAEKTAEVREQKLAELVEMMTVQLVVPTTADIRMAQRVADRHARLLNEFGFATAEQLAATNASRAANRNALTDNWKKRGQVFAVRHRDESGRQREVFPLFQFDDGKPIKAVQGVLEAFGEGKAPWNVALWFTSNNGWLPGQARPVDLLASAPEAVVEAAQRDADGSAV
jgi:hypothetical protein